MGWIALRMLTGDRVKYLGILFGVAFSTLLIAQQASLFLNLVARGGASVSAVTDADLWIMDPRASQVDGTLPLPATDLYRVRGVPGVAWAVPHLRETASIRTDEGRLERASVVGVDDATLVGLPRAVVTGKPDDLLRPDAVMIDTIGVKKVFPSGDPIGKTFELNDRRAEIVGLIDVNPSFTSGVTIWTRYAQALNYVPGSRNRMTFVLAKAATGQEPSIVARRIEADTKLRARTSREFDRDSIMYVIDNTGIPINFGITVVLGFVVGVAIVGLTFSLFIRDNIKQFGALKAIGVTNRRIVGMVATQGLHVAAVGYALGLLLATVFFTATSDSDGLKGFYLQWQVAAGVGVVVVVMVFLTGLLAVQPVLRTEPAEVFR